MERFYRVLYTDHHFAAYCESRKTGIYRSTHSLVPPTWQQTCADRLRRGLPLPNEDELPLEVPGITGRFTEDGRRLLLRLAAERPNLNFTESEVREIGALDGWCAFRTASDVYRWAMAELPEREYPRLRFVEFLGEPISSVSENRGVVTQVQRFCTQLLTVEEFKQRHSL